MFYVVRYPQILRDIARYYQILIGMDKYCQILLDIVRHFQILTDLNSLLDILRWSNGRFIYNSIRYCKILWYDIDIVKLRYWQYCNFANIQDISSFDLKDCKILKLVWCFSDACIMLVWCLTNIGLMLVNIISVGLMFFRCLPHVESTRGTINRFR